MKPLTYYRKINRLLATGFYSGYLPVAPGSWGSFLALILLFFFPFLRSFLSIILVITAGIFISHLEEYYTGKKDETKVVIDEIAGIFITFFGIPLTFWSLLCGFLLFRIFDIFKPYLIDRVQDLPGGMGVMADDVLAGIIANIFLQLIFYLI
ncbi:MAG: phosphatidylglycerophosphatase A [Halanaerobiales bacterium]